MSLRTGAWRFDGNGFRGTLNINSVDGQGNVTGTMLVDAPRVDPIRGFWDEASKKITFMRIINAQDPLSIQIFTGFGFDNSRDLPTDPTFFLTGFFEAFQDAGGSAQRSVFGWFATLHVVG